jgi:Uma2 family endonuclease
MEPMLQKKTWTEDELLALDVEGKCELVEGELVVTPAGYEHGIIGIRVATALEGFVRPRKLGRVAGPDLGCWMKNGSLRSPDVSFIRTERLRRLVADVRRFFPAAPDLAVEVLSPSESLRNMNDKINEYFDSGAQSVWIVDPETESVTVFHPGCDPIVFTVPDTLEDETILPGFSLPLSDLFEEL